MIGTITVFCLGMIVIALGLIGVFGAPDDPSNKWTGWVMLPFMLIMMQKAVARLLDRRVKVVVNGDGFVCDDWSDTFIPWSAVTAMRMDKDDGDLFFEMHLADPALYPERRGLSRLARGASLSSSRHIRLNVSGMDRSVEELREALRTFAPEHLLRG